MECASFPSDKWGIFVIYERLTYTLIEKVGDFFLNFKSSRVWFEVRPIIHVKKNNDAF